MTNITNRLGHLAERTQPNAGLQTIIDAKREIKRLQAKNEQLRLDVEFLEDAFRMFSHAVSLEDLYSGTIGVMPRKVIEQAVKAAEGDG